MFPVVEGVMKRWHKRRSCGDAGYADLPCFLTFPWPMVMIRRGTSSYVPQQKLCLNVGGCGRPIVAEVSAVNYTPPSIKDNVIKLLTIVWILSVTAAHKFATVLFPEAV
jgi:hypothetical protein